MAPNNHPFTKQLVYYLLCSQLIFIEHLLFSGTKTTFTTLQNSKNHPSKQVTVFFT